MVGLFDITYEQFMKAKEVGWDYHLWKASLSR